MKKMQCWKKTNVCQWGMNPHSVSENKLPALSAWNKIVTPSPYHAHAKKSTTLKHLKTLTHQLIFYIPKLFLKENILLKIFSKNACHCGIKKNTPFFGQKKLYPSQLSSSYLVHANISQLPCI